MKVSLEHLPPTLSTRPLSHLSPRRHPLWPHANAGKTLRRARQRVYANIAGPVCAIPSEFRNPCVKTICPLMHMPATQTGKRNWIRMALDLAN